MSSAKIPHDCASCTKHCTHTVVYLCECVRVLPTLSLLSLSSAYKASFHILYIELLEADEACAFGGVSVNDHPLLAFQVVAF